MFDMKRRDFITLLGGAAAAWPLAARAGYTVYRYQQTERGAAVVAASVGRAAARIGLADWYAWDCRANRFAR